MVKTKLVYQAIHDGAALLRELDRQNFPVDAMFWIHVPEGYWRLIIGSPVVVQSGVLAGYHKLNDIYMTLDLQWLALEDVSLLDPNSKQFLSLRSDASRSSMLGSEECWAQYDEAIVYRWNNNFLKGRLSCLLTADDLNRFWKAQRKLENSPSLLIDLAGREVTLRFHPGHGDFGDLENIRADFQTALHRPTARPDCQITWFN